MTQWIDFKALRSRLNFEAVLRHYGVTLTRKGDQVQGFCPLPNHGGQKRSPSFSANLRRGVWQCFGCGAKGNVLDFAIRMEGLSPDNTSDVRTVALRLCEAFQIEASGRKPGTATVTRPEERVEALPFQGEDAQAAAKSEVRVNEPLDFELKGLCLDHPYLLGRGFTMDTIKRFGLGYCTRGLMAGRIVIPLNDAEGRLVGYAGRIADDTKVGEDVPKYKFPSGRERTGVTLEFQKSRILYNAHTLVRPAEHLVIVEGFASVWWLTQAGISNAVALMGSSCSPAQAELIVASTSNDARLTILPDGDEAGERCAHSVFDILAPRRWVRWGRLPKGRQPTDIEPYDLQGVLRA